MYHDKVASMEFAAQMCSGIMSSCPVSFVQLSIRSLLLWFFVCSTRSLLCSIGSVLKETQ